MATAHRIDHRALVAFAVTLCTAPAARAFVGDRSGTFGVDGSVRTILVATANYDAPLLFGDDNPADGLGQTLIRLVAGGYPTDWLSVEAHLLQSTTLEAFAGAAALTGRSTGGNALLGQAAGPLPYRLVPLELRFGERPRGNVDARVGLDRLQVSVATPWLDLTLGRQALSFGKAYFWNPLDPFFAFSPTQFDRDYKIGVDAARLDLPLGELAGVTLVAAGGDLDAADPWREAALVARGFATLAGWDLSLQGGKVRGGWHAGLGAAGEAGPVELRAELAGFVPLDDDQPLARHVAGVVGAGYRFTAELGLQLEHLVNGGAPQDDLGAAMVLVAGGWLQQAGRQVSGAVLTWQALPILGTSLAALVEWDHGSWLLQPGLSYSAADEVDLVAGAALAFGPRPDGFRLRSELGSYPTFFYLEAKVYF